MKKLLLLFVLTLQSLMMSADMKNAGILNRKDRFATDSNKNLKSLSLKSYLIAAKEFKTTSKDRIKPGFSVNLLSGKGIHLFNTPVIGSIPAMNVGASFKASIKFTL